MNVKPVKAAALLLVVWTASSPEWARAQDAGDSQSTSFVYRGAIHYLGQPAEGGFDLSFQLFDGPEGGVLLGSHDAFDVVAVQGGVEVEVDFGLSPRFHPVRWLEVSVRRAGVGPYTTLSPRERLTEKGAAACSVVGDVDVQGSIGSDGLEVRGFFSSLDITAQRLQAGAFGVPGPLLLNPNGGNVGVGASSPIAPLHLTGLPDVNPSSGGALVIGAASGLNLAFDNNEIMARNGGQAAQLTLNHEGGDVRIGGTLEIGHAVVTSTSGCDSSGGITVTCPAGLKVVGGGCSSGYGQEELEESRPAGDNGWHCRFDSCPVVFGNWKAHAICLRVK